MGKFLAEEGDKARKMHSLSLRVFTDFTGSSAARSSPCRGGYGGFSLGEFNSKACRIIACAPERNGNGGGRSRSSSSNTSTTPSSFLSRSQTYALLKQQMEVATKSEVSVFLFFSSLSGLPIWGEIVC